MRRRDYRNYYKGHMDKNKGVWKRWREVDLAGVGRNGGGKMQTTVIEQL